MTFPLDPDAYLRMHRQRLERDLIANKRAKLVRQRQAQRNRPWPPPD